jgi:HAD-hyrolase-like
MISATLVAMHRGLYWRTSDGLQLDSGAFIAGLEQAAGLRPRWWASPPAAFFATALAHLGTGAAHTLMVGDDVETDVLAARRQGLTGVLVKTGKYLPSAHHNASGTPTTSLAPSPTCRPCSGTCRDRRYPRICEKGPATTAWTCRIASVAQAHAYAFTCMVTHNLGEPLVPLGF